jgi:hypothetical protein
MDQLSDDDWFCENPDCLLHVRAGDPGVMGQGNWAELPDGRWAGRGRYLGRMLCDFCGRATIKSVVSGCSFDRRRQNLTTGHS